MSEWTESSYEVRTHIKCSLCCTLWRECHPLVRKCNQKERKERKREPQIIGSAQLTRWLSLFNGNATVFGKCTTTGTSSMYINIWGACINFLGNRVFFAAASQALRVFKRLITTFNLHLKFFGVITLWCVKN